MTHCSGGSGDEALSQLDPDRVYVTLVPEGASVFNIGFTNSDGELATTSAVLEDGQVMYLETTDTAPNFAIINQRVEPLDDEELGARPWQRLFSGVTPDEGQIEITVSNLGDGNIAADAVRRRSGRSRFHWLIIWMRWMFESTRLTTGSTSLSTHRSATVWRSTLIPHSSVKVYFLISTSMLR